MKGRVPEHESSKSQCPESQTAAPDLVGLQPTPGEAKAPL